MQKAYVSVICRCDKEGVMQPIRICWDDGRSWDVKRVLHTCTAAHHEFEGIRYTIKIGSAEKYLYRDGRQWYVDRSP